MSADILNHKESTGSSICAPDTEINYDRIATVEKFFGFPQFRLAQGDRVLVGEGILKKMCRKKLKDRHFFLFNDILLYGNIIVHRKKLSNPRFIDLCSASVEDLENSALNNGFSIKSLRKSFTVYTGTREEKSLWIMHLTHSINNCKNQKPSNYHGEEAPIWVPDSEASRCMVCSCEFSRIKRKHHCRNCGKVICDKCSMNKWLLPLQNSKKVRVCEPCYSILKSKSSEASIDSQKAQTRPNHENDTGIRNSHFFHQSSPCPVAQASSQDDLNSSHHGLNYDSSASSDSY